MIHVWDLPTRIFHWTLVLAMFVCVYTSYDFYTSYDLGFLGQNVSSLAIHQYAGVLILALLIFRVIWGIFGSTTSRFSDFIKGPSHIINYLKTSKTPTEGHNPLGALMVVALILMLLVQVVTGLFLEDNSYYLFKNAPLADTALGKNFRGIFATIHANGRAVVLWLIGLHVAAVFAYLIIKKQNLIRTMVTGKRSLKEAHTPNLASIQKDRSLIGIILLIAIVVLTYYILFNIV